MAEEMLDPNTFGKDPNEVTLDFQSRWDFNITDKDVESYLENPAKKSNFTAVVVSVEDPEKKGRIKVRVIGFHDDKTKEDDLPWAVTIGTDNQGIGSKGFYSKGQYVTVEPISDSMTMWMVIKGSTIYQDPETDKKEAYNKEAQENKNLTNDAIPKTATADIKKLKSTLFSKIIKKLINIVRKKISGGGGGGGNPSMANPKDVFSKKDLKIIATEANFEKYPVDQFGRSYNIIDYVFIDNNNGATVSKANVSDIDIILDEKDAKKVIGYNEDGTEVYPIINDGILEVPKNIQEGIYEIKYEAKYKDENDKNTQPQTSSEPSESSEYSKNKIILKIVAEILEERKEPPPPPPPPAIPKKETTPTKPNEAFYALSPAYREKILKKISNKGVQVKYFTPLNTQNDGPSITADDDDGYALPGDDPWVNPKAQISEKKSGLDKGEPHNKQVTQFPNYDNHKEGMYQHFGFGSDHNYELAHPSGARMQIDNAGNITNHSNANYQVLSDSNIENYAAGYSVNVADGFYAIHSPQTVMVSDMLTIQSDAFIKGDVTIKGDVIIEGDLLVEGDIVCESDVIISGISFLQHVHPETNATETKPPK